MELMCDLQVMERVVDLRAESAEEAREMLGRLHGQAAMGPLDWLMTGDVLEQLGPQHRDAAIAAWERSSRLRPTEAVRVRLSRVGRPVLP